MCNPFDHSQDALYEAKHQCMLNNNVRILKEIDYKFAIDYFNTKQYNINDFIVDKDISL